MQTRTTLLTTLLCLLPLGPAACEGGSNKDGPPIDTGPWDDDGDGIYAKDDCDDTISSVGEPSVWYEDDDDDGSGNPDVSETACNQPAGFTDNANDCDDTTEFVSPIAKERCDEMDNDCDGEIDEDDSIDATTWYPDADDDGYGDEAQPTPKCSQPRGYLEDGTDCNDADEEIHPGVCEICGDDIDNDCDGIEVCADLSEADVVLRGEAAGDGAGTQLRPAGDFNGDAVSDMVIAAPGAGGGGGNVYIIAGPLEGDESSVLDGNLFATGSSSTTDGLGTGLAGVGDLDGNGYDDVMAGAPGGNYATLFPGPDGAGSFNFTGEEEGDEAGTSIAHSGDVDDDGQVDLVIGSPANYGGADGGGAVHLVYGPIDDTYDLYNSDAVWYGDAEGQRAGSALTGMDDMDGDGYGDFLFGADGLDSTAGVVGAVYIIYGPQVGLYGTDDVDVKWFGEALGDAAAYPSNVGDVNGDGLPDVGVAVPGAVIEEEPSSGAIYIWYGAHYTVLDNVNHGDARLLGESDGDTLFLPNGGTSDGFGDLNSDGYDDLWIGASGEDTNGDSAGASYVIYGPITGEMDLCTSDIHYYGEAAGDLSGTSAVGGGDLNDDGVPDLLVGAPYNDEAGEDAGSAYVVFGGW